MIKKIIDHWCIYYVWGVRRYDKKWEAMPEKKISKEMLHSVSKSGATDLILFPISMYITLYIGLPLLVLFRNSEYFLLRNSWIVSILIFLFISYVLVFEPIPYFKNKENELMSIENWEISPYRIKGRKLFWFHSIFPFVSMGIVMLIAILLIDYL